MHEGVLNTDMADIARKPRIAMRDPQQSAVAPMGPASIAHFELPSFQQTRHDAGAEARAIIDEARETAATMLDQARSARDSELEAARRQGHELGYNEGLEAADRDTAGLINAAEQIAVNVAREREHLLEQSEGEIVELALAIAQRIVNAAIEIEPQLVIDVCRGAMRKAFQRDSLTVLAHADDLAMLRSAGPIMAQELGGIHQLDFVEERRLQRGSVVVRTPAGEIDATFDGKAAKIEAGLRELIEIRRAESRQLRRAG